MTGTAMSANVEQLVRASPIAGWHVVRALTGYFCDVSGATIEEWKPVNASLDSTGGKKE